MRNYNLNIAGYKIRIEASADAPELFQSDRFLSNICDENDPDVIISVRSGKYNLPAGAEKVLSAPYVEEINGIRVKNNDEFWNVYKHHNDLYISTFFPLSSENKRATLKFSLTDIDW